MSALSHLSKCLDIIDAMRTRIDLVMFQLAPKRSGEGLSAAMDECERLERDARRLREAISNGAFELLGQAPDAVDTKK